MKRQIKNGFTLIELLVVISIIALLLSILMPGLNRAKQAAQSVVCLSNLKQCGVVVNSYAIDNKNKLQYHWFARNQSGGPMFNNMSDSPKIMWMYAAESYYQDPKLMQCPIAKTLKEPLGADGGVGDVTHAWIATWAQPLKSTGKPATSGLTFNDWLGSEGQTATGAGVTSNVFGSTLQSQPDKIPVMLDGSWYHTMPSPSDLPPRQDPRKNPRMAIKDGPGTSGTWFGYVTLPRHQQKTQAVFLDGSAKKLGLRSLWELKWNKTWRYSDCRVAKPGFDWGWMKSLPE